MSRRLIVSIFVLSGCGPSLKDNVARLPPAKSEAVHELEAGVRQIKLGPQSYARALERLEAARQIDPNLWEAWYDTGWVLQEMRQLEKAAEAYEKALAINAAHAPSVAALGAAYLGLRRPGDAARVYRRFLDGNKAVAPAVERSLRIQLASALRQSGKGDDAIAELRNVLRGDGRNASALAGLGLVYESKGQHELAELVIRRALEVVDKDRPQVAAAAWNDLGLVLLSLRRDQEAFAAFDKAAALDPQLAEARYNRAAVYLDCGDYGSAAKELARLTEAQAGNVEAWVALGVAQRGLGKLDEARRAYEQALAVDPNDPSALYNEGVLLMDFKKDPAEARGYFTRFIHAADSSHPKRPDAEARLKDLTKNAPPPAPEHKGN